MNYQNYLYLEYRRAIRKFHKLQTRFEKRISKDTFQELTARRRYKLLSQLRKLKQKIEQLTGRLKLAAAGGAIAFSMGIQDSHAQIEEIPLAIAIAASGAEGVPKVRTASKTLLNEETTGAQNNPDVAYNNNGDFVAVWQQDDYDIYIRVVEEDTEQSTSFSIIGGEDELIEDPAVSFNDEGEFVVAWTESTAYGHNVKYSRYSGLTSEGTHTVVSGSTDVNDVDVALDNSGNIAITWQEDGGESSIIKASYFDEENSSGGELDVSQNSIYEQKEPAIDLDEEGNFIVVWNSQEDQEGIVHFVKGRKYKDGVALGSEMDLYSEGGEGIIKSPDVALNGDGGFVASWAYGAGGEETIGAQVFDAEGGEFSSLINVHSSEVESVYTPQIAADKDGGFMVVFSTYEEYYGGGEEWFERFSITGERYNRFGDNIDSKQFYYSDLDFNVAKTPALGMNDRGDFVVAWADNLSDINGEECSEYIDCDSYGVYFTRYQDAANPPYTKSSNEIVNTTSNGSQVNSSIAKDGDGNYVVVWEGYVDEGNPRDIFGQRFDDTGEKIGVEFRINTTTDDFQTDPDVAMNPDGEFIVTWKGDVDNSQYGVFAQMYTADGVANGSEIRVDDETSGMFDHNQPSVAIDDDGDAIIVYVEEYYDHIQGRRINANGTVNGDEFKIDSYTFSGARHHADVALANDGGFVATFGRYSGGEEHTYFRKFNAADAPLDANDVKISSGAFTDIRRQSIVMDPADGDFAIAYTEYYDDYSAVYVSKFNSNGSVTFENTEITDYASNSFVPQLDMNDSGEIAVVWGEPDDGDITRASMLDEYGEYIYENYAPFGTSSTGSGPTLILNDDGDATVVRTRSSDIYKATVAKPLDIDIDASIEFVVNSVSTNSQHSPDVAQNADGDFVVVWTDYYNASGSAHTIKAQRYNIEGIRQGGEIKVNNGTTNSVNDAAVALNNDGNFMVVWTESASGGEDYNIYGNVFDWDGNNVEDDFMVNESTNNYQYSPDIEVNPTGDFQVIWSEYYGGVGSWNRIYGQKYSSGGEADLLGNLNLIDVEETADISLYASIAINNDGDIAIPYVYNYDGSTSGLHVFNSSFEPLTEDAVFSESSYVIEDNIGIAASADDDFVLAWSEGGESSALFVRKYNIENGFTTEANHLADLEVEDVTPSIAAVDDGDFIFSYVDGNDYYNVYVTRISSHLEPIGPQIQINDIELGGFSSNAIASSPDGSYTIVWESGYADNSGDAVMARQFVSHKPTVDNNGLNLDEGEEVTIGTDHLTATNSAGNSENAYFTFISVPDHGTLTFDGGAIAALDELEIDDINQLTYTHDGSETTADTFNFTVTNENFETTELTFDITVNPVNDLPDLTANNSLEIDEGDSQSLYETLSVSDPDNSSDEITYKIISVPEFGTLSFSESVDALEVGDTFTQEDVGFGDIYYNNDGSESSSDSFEFTLSDEESTSETHQYNIIVNPVNDAPTLANAIEDQSGTIDEDFSLELDENVFSDADGDVLTLTATLADGSALPEWLTFDPTTATFSGTPDEAASYTVKVTVDDGEETVSDEFVLTITAGNSVPTVANAITDQSTIQYQNYSFEIPANTFSDDGELSLTASLANDGDLPSWLSFAAGTNTLSGTPIYNDHGEISIKVTATDGSEESVSTTFNLEIVYVLDVDQEELNEISFYPNPTDHQLNLTIDDSMSGAIQVMMFNQSGRMVHETLLNKTQSAQVFEIDIQNLRSGIYLLKLVNENTTSTFKINKK